MGMYPSWLILFINHKVNEWITLEFSPMIQNTTGATPALGTNVGAGKAIAASPFALQKGEFPVAKAVIRLPNQYELTLGQFYQRLTWAYGDSASWEEHLMCPRELYRSSQQQHDSGAQLYKEFDVNGYILPVTMALTSGAGFGPDNNQSMAFMVKLEPEYEGIRFNTAYMYNPLAAGDDVKYALGSQGTFGPWYFRTEYHNYAAARGRTVYTPSTNTTAFLDTRKANGYNFTLKYQLLDNFSLNTSFYYFETNGSKVNDADNYKEIYNDLYYGLIYTIADGAEFMVTYETGDYSKNSPLVRAIDVSTESLKFNRLEVGTRITF
jgi:hypothetical protein